MTPCGVFRWGRPLWSLENHNEVTFSFSRLQKLHTENRNRRLCFTGVKWFVKEQFLFEGWTLTFQRLAVFRKEQREHSASENVLMMRGCATAGTRRSHETLEMTSEALGHVCVSAPSKEGYKLLVGKRKYSFEGSHSVMFLSFDPMLMVWQGTFTRPPTRSKMLANLASVVASNGCLGGFADDIFGTSL